MERVLIFGGVAEKIVPAIQRYIRVILIDRPKEASHAR